LLVKSSLSSFIGRRAPSRKYIPFLPFAMAALPVACGGAQLKHRAPLLLVHQRQKLFIALSSGAAPTRCRPAAFITSSFKDTVAPGPALIPFAINSGEIGHGCYLLFPQISPIPERREFCLFCARSRHGVRLFFFLCASTAFWNGFKIA
jgi:hypothetical protein